jgi:hypothetical protein
MAGHKWRRGKYNNIFYGKMKNNELRNTNGVYINPEYGGVYISHWNQDGNESAGPRIYCDEDEINIYE